MLTAFKLKIKDISQPFVAYPAIYASIQESHDQLMAQNTTQGLDKVWEKLPQKPDW